MLSERIAYLAAQVEDYGDDGIKLDGLGVAAIGALLRDMAEDAATLEQNTRPLIGMGGAAPFTIPEGGNVVRLETGR